MGRALRAAMYVLHKGGVIVLFYLQVIEYFEGLSIYMSKLINGKDS